MSTTQPIPAVSDVVPAQPVQSAAPAAAVGGGSAQDQADLRLVIEEDKAAGTYVYKTVDSRTGKVVQQIPREQLLRMREAWSYQPGSVVDSRG